MAYFKSIISSKEVKNKEKNYTIDIPLTKMPEVQLFDFDIYFQKIYWVFEKDETMKKRKQVASFFKNIPIKVNEPDLKEDELSIFITYHNVLISDIYLAVDYLEKNKFLNATNKETYSYYGIRGNTKLYLLIDDYIKLQKSI